MAYSTGLIMDGSMYATGGPISGDEEDPGLDDVELVPENLSPLPFMVHPYLCSRIPKPGC